jgi:hypothetical protein
MEEIYCYECGEELELEDMNSIHHIGGGEYICDECREAYYVYCDDCGRLVYEGHTVSVEDDTRLVCPDCENEYYICDHCGGLYSENNLAVNNYQITLCEYCYSDRYFTCPGCHGVFNVDEGTYLDDEYFCYECADERAMYSCIMSYSYKPEPIFFGGHAGYGVELEIDDGDDKEEAARDIQTVAGNHIYIKEDGSLSYNGMEIVTHPATLDYHVNEFPWDDICDTALSYGYRSHDTDTCGLHIHASRVLFGDTETEQDLTIAKIMLLVDRWYDTHIVRFARRDISKMRRWADKPNADIQPEDDNDIAIYKAKKTSNHRYKAVNLCNRATVEFRLFKGTLKRDTIVASIQWVDTIIRYCRKTPLKNLFDATWDDIFATTNYAELTEYLKRRGLYDIKEEI